MTVNKDGARVVIIDRVKRSMKAMAGEQTLVPQMHELLTFLNQRGVVTFLVVAIAGTVAANLSTPVDTSYRPEKVLLLRFFEAGSRLRKAVSAVKKRGSARPDIIRKLTSSADAVVVGQALSASQDILTGTPAYFASTVEKSGDSNEPQI